MSAIVGFLDFNQPLGDTRGIDGMLDAMSHRCPDGKGTFCSRNIAMGFGAFHSTIEEEGITAPYALGNKTIVVDGRLDNRGELHYKLSGYRSSECHNLSDHELIIWAYEKWDVDCLKHLEGAFSFALWDRDRLFCARDRFGIKPFTYYLDNSFFAFSSEIKGLLALDEVKTSYDYEQLCHHFVPQLLMAETVKTYYRNIFRLPPAHGMIMAANGTRAFKYWELDPSVKTAYASENEYYEHFHELLRQSVINNMRSKDPVGTALSGGLDSSAITCLARDYYNDAKQRELRTFSCVFDKAAGSDESQWIRSVEEAGAIAPHHLHIEDTPYIDDIEAMLWLHEGPFYGGNYYLQRALYKSAQKSGVNVFLDGEDGDGIVSHGYDYLSRLAGNAGWKDFFYEVEGMVKNFQDEKVFFSQNYLFGKYGYPHLRSQLQRGKYFKLIKNINLIHAIKNNSRKRMFLSLLFGNTDSGALHDDLLVKNEILNEYRILEKLKKVKSTDKLNIDIGSDNFYHYHGIEDCGNSYALEFMDRLSYYHGVEVRHPFYDHRLAEYCLSVPSNVKLRNGYTRYYFRESMKGILPEDVRMRKGKGDLTHMAVYGYRKYHDQFLNDNMAKIKEDDPLVSKNKAESLRKDCFELNDDSKLLESFALATYSLWQRKRII